MALKSSAVVKDLTEKLGNNARLAAVLAVDKTTVGRWLEGDGFPTAENNAKLMALEFVYAKLLKIYQPKTADKWLFGNNPHLDNKRPIDLIAQERVADVISALEIAETGAYV